MTTGYAINPKQVNYSIQDIISKIDKGFLLQDMSLEKELTDEEKLEYNDCIFLKPDYQREYRATQEDESSLIESVLVGIPIPPIFLANNRYKGVQILDVVDGQHRLRAFHRFCTNGFNLCNLRLLSDYNTKNFTNLDFTEREKIFSYQLPAYVFRDFPGKKFELEIFNRYNKGTKPLTPQEIRNAVYSSKYNDFVNSFVKDLLDDKDKKLKDAYNVTNDRFLKKKVHESIFVIIWILEYGINTSFNNSTDYAENYMKLKSELEEIGNDIEANYTIAINNFKYFNEWIIEIMYFVEYPFSKEIYGISSRNYKFQMSIAMILAGIYKKTYIDKMKTYNSIQDTLADIKTKLLNSFLEDGDYRASTTNSSKIKALIEQFNDEK